jgi:quercetin dioxygenase-like cupin family protein
MLTALAEPIVETIQADVAGLYFRSVLLKEVGTVIPQHVHPYDHATYIASGKVRLYAGLNLPEDYEAGQAVSIAAHVQHVFVSLAPNTRLCCVHHSASAEAAQRKE